MGRSIGGQGRHIALGQRARQLGPCGHVLAATAVRQCQRVAGPPACGAQRHGGRFRGHALPLQPVQGLLLIGPGHGVGQATAADGGQQLVGRLAGQHEAGIARRLLQRLEQRIGRDGVHLLGRVDQHGLAAPARAGALAELHGVAHGLDTDFLAGLALLVVDVGLGLLGQRPAQRHHLHLGHEHAQVGMGAHVDGVAAAAVAAGPLGRRRLAQPGAHQRQRQRVLAQAGRPLQQPGVAALGQQARALPGDPGGVGLGRLWQGLAHAAPACPPTMMASQPRRTMTCVICCQTACRLALESMRAKRWGAAAARAA